jgi:hypothetical protein
MLLSEVWSTKAQALEGRGGQMNAWRKYESDIAEQRRRERLEMWDEVEAIRKRLGVNVLDFSEEPNERDNEFLKACGISWGIHA